MSLFDRVATAPISWGVCEVPGWGHQLSVDRVLGEMAELGFNQTELGSLGWLPTEPSELNRVLSTHELGLLAGFVPLVLHDGAEAEATEKAALEAAELLRAGGAIYFNTAPVMSWDWAPRRDLTDAEWSRLIGGLAMVQEICADTGLTQVIHEHVGIAIETVDDVNRLLESSPVKFVLDTAHLALGGADPLEFAQRHPERVGLVHLKDMDSQLARTFTSSQRGDSPQSLMAAVQAGLFPALGDGDLPIGAIVTTLEESGFNGWYVVEQDCAITGDAPGAGEGPINDVRVSVEYLASLDLFNAAG
ncbi:MAG: TIM barrel protein [Acidimicrobiales bacterium]|nr:TIM barrel protein [Acidimicrobiales bacterium]